MVRDSQIKRRLLGLPDAKVRISAIQSSDQDNFVWLVKLARLDPSKDFRFSDLSGVNFSGCDLAGFDFTGANLIGCNFQGARLEGAIFAEAHVRNSNLSACLEENSSKPKEVRKAQLPEQSASYGKVGFFRSDIRLRVLTLCGIDLHGLVRMVEVSEIRSDRLDEFILKVASKRLKRSQFMAFLLLYSDEQGRNDEIVRAYNSNRQGDIKADTSLAVIQRNARRGAMRILENIDKDESLKKLIKRTVTTEHNLQEYGGASGPKR